MIDGPNIDPVPCIVCGKQLDSVSTTGCINQPWDGTTFSSYGHYGSIWDENFMTTNRSLEIIVCDPCLTKAAQDKRVYIFAATVVTRPAPTHWRPDGREMIVCLECHSEYDVKGYCLLCAGDVDEP